MRWMCRTWLYGGYANLKCATMTAPPFLLLLLLIPPHSQPPELIHSRLAIAIAIYGQQKAFD